ncbi:helix-turn-helix transcriptional regulator [Megasphaera stantonii]|uniref:helix-turn-helix domain-containing protein n=1 Tax=Megasphaera stantonii TaxID=2144175 RepID=UPI002941BF7F|nr:helix-turn-helix transcriptional regulator [Megasphaera stantonii]
MDSDKKRELMLTSTETEIGKRFKAVRLSYGDDQITFANKLGISQSYLSAIERGTRQPSVRVMKTLADMGFSIDWIYSGKSSDNLKSLKKRQKDMAFIRDKLDAMTDDEVSFIRGWLEAFDSTHK